MTATEVFKSAYALKQKYPGLRRQIDSILDLMEMEIEDGEPEENEAELAWSDIKDLVEEND